MQLVQRNMSLPFSFLREMMQKKSRLVMREKEKSLISSELSIESLLAAVSNSLNVNPSGVVYHSCLQHESFLTVSHLSFQHTWHRRRNISHIPQVSITYFLYLTPFGTISTHFFRIYHIILRFLVLILSLRISRIPPFSDIFIVISCTTYHT